MKTISAGYKADLANGSTTIARCWKATRRDGFVLAVTSCARDILFEGVLYRSAYGFNPKAVSQEASQAVVNTEVEGFLSDQITEDDFAIGLWDGCTVEIFEVNYRALANGRMVIATMTMGNIHVTRNAFNAEMRGLTQRLQKTVGRIVTATCPWVFGDPDTCRVNLAPLTVTGAFTSVTDRRTMADSSRTEADDHFGGGVLEVTSGAAAGERIEVYSYTQSGGAIVLHLPLQSNAAVGDTYTLTPGCRKRFAEDCRAKWNNIVNFGGFPLLPGNDKILGLGGTEGTQL